jgi:hypothetical protein
VINEKDVKIAVKAHYMQRNKEKNDSSVLTNNPGCAYVAAQEENIYPPRILYPEKISFKNKDKISTFSNIHVKPESVYQ